MVERLSTLFLFLGHVLVTYPRNNQQKMKKGGISRKYCGKRIRLVPSFRGFQINKVFISFTHSNDHDDDFIFDYFVN